MKIGKLFIDTKYKKFQTAAISSLFFEVNIT